jgi:hypothetical protein
MASLEIIHLVSLGPILESDFFSSVPVSPPYATYGLVLQLQYDNDLVGSIPERINEFSGLRDLQVCMKPISRPKAHNSPQPFAFFSYKTHSCRARSRDNSDNAHILVRGAVVLA